MDLSLCHLAADMVTHATIKNTIPRHRVTSKPLLLNVSTVRDQPRSVLPRAGPSAHLRSPCCSLPYVVGEVTRIPKESQLKAGSRTHHPSPFRGSRALRATLKPPQSFAQPMCYFPFSMPSQRKANGQFCRHLQTRAGRRCWCVKPLDPRRTFCDFAAQSDTER